jgi:hypothetical protein
MLTPGTDTMLAIGKSLHDLIGNSRKLTRGDARRGGCDLRLVGSIGIRPEGVSIVVIRRR